MDDLQCAHCCSCKSACSWRLHPTRKYTYTTTPRTKSQKVCCASELRFFNFFLDTRQRWQSNYGSDFGESDINYIRGVSMYVNHSPTSFQKDVVEVIHGSVVVVKRSSSVSGAARLPGRVMTLRQTSGPLFARSCR